MSGYDTFERSYVFRVARFLPLLAAGASGVALVIAGALAVYSLTPARTPASEPLRPDPAAVRVSRADILARLSADSVSASSAGVASGPSVMRAGPSEAARRLAEQLDSLRTLVTQAGLQWENSYELVCTSYYYSCYGWDRRISAVGARRRITEVLDLYDSSEGIGDERVEIGGTRRVAARSYSVNASNAEAKMLVLGELVEILNATERENYGRVLRGWNAIRKERESARRQSIEAELARVAGVNQARAQEYSDALGRRVSARALGFSAAVAALGVVLGAGIILAQLAVERNTRALQGVLGRLEAGRT